MSIKLTNTHVNAMMATQDTTAMLKSTNASRLLAFVVRMSSLVAVFKTRRYCDVKSNSHLLTVATCSYKFFVPFCIWKEGSQQVKGGRNDLFQELIIFSL